MRVWSCLSLMSYMLSSCLHHQAIGFSSPRLRRLPWASIAEIFAGNPAANARKCSTRGMSCFRSFQAAPSERRRSHCFNRPFTLLFGLGQTCHASSRRGSPRGKTPAEDTLCGPGSDGAEVVMSSTNAKVKTFKALLGSRHMRLKHGSVRAFEGIRAIRDIISKAGILPIDVVVSERASRGTDFVSLQRDLEGTRLQPEMSRPSHISNHNMAPKFTRITIVSDTIFTSISDTINSQGIVASFDLKDVEWSGRRCAETLVEQCFNYSYDAVSNSTPSSSSFTTTTTTTTAIASNRTSTRHRSTSPPALSHFALLALDGVSDPGNCGALVRSARAFGASGFVSVGGCDPYAPKAMRASMGAVASLRVATIDSWKEFYLAVINAISDRKDALFSYSDPSNEAIKRSSSCGSSITGVRRGKINVYIASAATSQLFADRAESPGAHRKKNKDRAKATVDHSNQRCDVYGSMNSLPIQVHFEAGPLPYYEADFVSPYVLVIGSEARGASKDVWEGVHHAIAAAPTTTPNTTPTTTPTGATAATPLATTVSPADLVSPAGRIDIHFYHIHVPMIDGAVESLNAAVAGSVILSEALRQRIERETDRERGGG